MMDSTMIISDDSPGAMPATEQFDEPFPTTANGEAPTLPDAAGDDQDPWAIMAKAAGEEIPPAAAEPSQDAAGSAPGVVQTSHAEGETFSMDVDPASAPAGDFRASLAATVQASTQFLQSKIHEVDEKAGISLKLKEVDEQHHISEKLGSFNEKIVKPTTEKTKEVTEKVKPSIQQGWGSIVNKSTEMGIGERWSSISSAVGTKWNETAQHVGENVEHFKAEQEKKRALANANGGAAAPQLKPQLEDARVKVVSGWNKGLGWVSQQLNKSESSDNVRDDREMARLDSDGLPSSFRKE